MKMTCQSLKMHSKHMILIQTWDHITQEEMTGMGFDSNNYSPIPPVGNVVLQQGTALPTSTPKPVVEANMNTSDPTHSRGKVKIINSFTTNQEQVETTEETI